MTPKEAIAIIDTQARYYYEQRIDHVPDDRGGLREMEVEQKEYQSLCDAISVLAHHLIPRTEPPSVEEVGDEEVCLAYYHKGRQAWQPSSGYTVRRYWNRVYNRWLPVPVVEATP